MSERISSKKQNRSGAFALLGLTEGKPYYTPGPRPREEREHTFTADQIAKADDLAEGINMQTHNSDHVYLTEAMQLETDALALYNQLKGTPGEAAAKAAYNQVRKNTLGIRGNVYESNLSLKTKNQKPHD